MVFYTVFCGMGRETLKDAAHERDNEFFYFFVESLNKQTIS